MKLIEYWPATIMGLGAFMATFDVTAVSLALPAIREDLSLDVSTSIWIMNAYGLAFTVFLIGAGAVSDRFGNRLALVMGTFLFLTASVICAMADSLTVILAGRILQGCAAAFIVCGGYALMGHLYPQKAQRVEAFAIMGVISGSALAVGPGLGGIIANQFGWIWIFLINVPVCLLIAAGALLGMKERKGEKIKSLDLPGILTFGSFLLIASWSMLNGPSIAGHEIGVIPVVTILGLLLTAFVWIEMRAETPAVQMTIFQNATFNGLALVPLCLSISYWSLIVFIPLYLKDVFEIDTQQSAYVLLAFTLPMFLVPYLVTDVAKRWSEAKFFSSGLLIVALGCLAIAIGSHHISYGFTIAGMVLAGSGAAAMQTQVSGALIASVSQDQAGAVTALMTILRQGGFALGTALLSLTLVLDIGQLKNFTILFLTCALVAALGGALTFLLLQPKMKQEGSFNSD
ncbi:MAG: MFS transporter [Cohaesibacter sp.]|nr:MFS transporter [Cohaesibacter sp.]